MRKSFDISIKELHNDLLRMGCETEKQIYNAVKALQTQDISLANKVIAEDDIIDEMQKEIDDKAIRLVAMQNPLATDLRDIFSATKVSSDLERMADHAVDIAKIAKKLSKENYIKKLLDIPVMADLVVKMITDGVDAYINGNMKDAYDIGKRDDDIDSFYKKIFDEFLSLIKTDTDKSNQVAQFLFVVKYLERIADHVTNICEQTIYVCTGNYKDLNE
ncbi:phosphate signaling complex protein PhoU [Clostridium cellulovorans]|uniref:Phosphate-specific transport system accessory protein PhoU n=1 Tax=Clostridium cellulovorans (strain ATCC 35296 / DSM 3052 / OCM 3 / 743B) TaxID=573061 RepID=D9SL86_CLOC7|nr:phosphate signaling complex protein PhoU [Clostridium cellulovorans]ADL51602.1 phosphate uptake regulator, PhoU [Clostridium cellulovorans 743B]